MNKLFLATAAFATLGLSAPASAVLINFEDVVIPSPGNTPALSSYAGFNWNNAYAFDNTVSAGSGLQGKPIGTKAIFGASGTFFQFSSATQFTFNSAFFASAITGDTLTITGYSNADVTGLLFTQVINITGSMTQFNFNWAGVRSVEVRGRGNNYAVDNITYNANATPAVPEPATWAMMMLGFGAMGYSLRRRTKVSARVRFA